MAGRAGAWRCSESHPLLRARTPGPHTQRGPTMLKGTDLSFSHDGAPLFDGVSLTLDDGARAALVGGNGVGTTTLIRLLAGVGGGGGGGAPAPRAAQPPPPRPRRLRRSAGALRGARRVGAGGAAGR